MIIKRREELPYLLNSLNAKIGVELGVCQGEFSKILLERWNGDTGRKNHGNLQKK